MTLSIDNYSLDLNPNDYLIEHFDELSPENQQTILAFLEYMEELRNSAIDYTTYGNNIDAEFVFIDYTNDVINTLTNHILATWPNAYQERLNAITSLNQRFKTNAYKTLFYNDLKRTPVERLIKEDDEFKLEQGEAYLKHLETNQQDQTYSVAVTDGHHGPVDIKINLTFKEALKDCLSHLEPKDIKQICNLYAVSTKDHKAALTRIQEIIEGHIDCDNEFYYDNGGNNNTVINVDVRPEPNNCDEAHIEISGCNFFAFAKSENNHQRTLI